MTNNENTISTSGYHAIIYALRRQYERVKTTKQEGTTTIYFDEKDNELFRREIDSEGRTIIKFGTEEVKRAWKAAGEEYLIDSANKTSWTLIDEDSDGNYDTITDRTSYKDGISINLHSISTKDNGNYDDSILEDK